MNEFGIVGYGIVGKATHVGLLKNNPIIYHDILFNTKLNDLQECEFVFFCIPTSTQEDINKLITEIVDLKKINPNYLPIIRSTVPVGTCEKIQDTIDDRILYIPEFLRDRYWDTDCLKEPIIIGSDNMELPYWLNKHQTIICSLNEAEILKMFNNNLAASKIVLANHFYDLAKKTDSNYQKILEMYFYIRHDQSYLEANEELRGFGGKCLTKDLDFLIETFDQFNLPQTFFKAIQEDNTRWPMTIRKS